MSSASRPATSMWNVSSACASFTPPRPTQGKSGATTPICASAGTLAPALLTISPPTRTRPARIRARARSRETASPSFTRRTSRRVRGGEGMAPPRYEVRETTHWAISARRLRSSGVPARAATAASAASCAMRFDASRPNRDGYVILPAAASLPAVLPSAWPSPTTSSTSSTIWNASPSHDPYRSTASMPADGARP